MSTQNSYPPRRSLGFPAQAEAQTLEQHTAHDVPYSPSSTTTDANSVQHVPSIPDYEVPELRGLPPDLLPRPGTVGWALDSASKRATLDLNGIYMPPIAPTNSQTTPYFVSPVTPHTYASPRSRPGGIATPSMHAYSQPFARQASSYDAISPGPPFLNASREPPPDLSQSSQKQSRLPTSAVGRKIPRTFSFVPAQFTQNSPKVVKESAESAVSVKESTDSAVRMGRRIAIRKDSTDPSSPLGEKTPRDDASQNTPAVTFPAGSKKAMASRRAHHTLTSQGAALDTNDRISPPVPSIEVDHEPEKHTAPPPITTRGMLRAKKQSIRPQPRYDYEVPPKLEGVQRALGADDWMELVILAEKYGMGEVSEKEFNAGSRRLFSTVDIRLHGRVQRMVVDLMIVPVVENLAKSEVK